MKKSVLYTYKFQTILKDYQVPLSCKSHLKDPRNRMVVSITKYLLLVKVLYWAMLVLYHILYNLSPNSRFPCPSLTRKRNCPLTLSSLKYSDAWPKIISNFSFVVFPVWLFPLHTPVRHHILSIYISILVLVCESNLFIF